MKNLSYMTGAALLASALLATPASAQATSGKDPSPTPGNPNVYTQKQPNSGPAVEGKDPSYTNSTGTRTTATPGVPAGQNSAKKKTDTNNN